MNWLFFRQYRTQLIVLGSILIAYVGFVIKSGLLIHAKHNSGLVLYEYLNIIRASVAFPALIGMFLGAPLIAKEFEAGTHRLVWTQGISRTKWLFSKLVPMLLVGAICGAILGVSILWWVHEVSNNATVFPFNSKFRPLLFGIIGLMPVVYSMFAVALGVLLGTYFRKVLLALALTMVLVAGINYGIAQYIRPYYEVPVNATYIRDPKTNEAIEPNSGDAGGLAVHYPKPTCHVESSKTYKGVTITGSYCGPVVGQHFGYQPAKRFWTFQIIESLIYLGLTALAVAATYKLVVSRDA